MRRGEVFGSRPRADALTLTSRIRRRRGLLVEFENRADDCALSFCGQEFRFPSRMLPAVEFVTANDTFTVSDVPDCLDAESKVTLVNRLVREGLLQALPDK